MDTGTMGFLTASPLLPALSVQRMYLVLSWGLVLAALLDGALRCWGAALLARCTRLPSSFTSPIALERLQRWVPRVVLLWCVLPIAGTPAYALGLAFQAPSVLTVIVSVTTLLRVRWQRNAVPDVWSSLVAQAPVWVALGWVLLLDTFALWPFSIYAWGFAPLTMGALALWALWPWLRGGRVVDSAALLAVLLVYLVLRVPDGNVWAAVLDPLLWLLLHTVGLRQWRAQRRKAKAS